MKSLLILLLVLISSGCLRSLTTKTSITVKVGSVPVTCSNTIITEKGNAVKSANQCQFEYQSHDGKIYRCTVGLDSEGKMIDLETDCEIILQ